MVMHAIVANRVLKPQSTIGRSTSWERPVSQSAVAEFLRGDTVLSYPPLFEKKNKLTFLAKKFWPRTRTKNVAHRAHPPPPPPHTQFLKASYTLYRRSDSAGHTQEYEYPRLMVWVTCHTSKSFLA